MASENKNYDVEGEIAVFFSKTSVRRETCDALARELVGSDQVVPVPVQGGVCSYTVYAGEGLGQVVQFRLKSREVKTETVRLARQVFGAFVPDVSFRQALGDDESTATGKEPLLVYVMPRVQQGLAHESGLGCRKEVDQSYRDRTAETFETDLQALLVSLPDRFHSVIRNTLASLPSILSLPMVLLDMDFGGCKIMVEEESCHLVGVVDWAEAEIGPFGTNLEMVQSLMSKLHLKNGWIRYEDYDDLTRSFWETLGDEIGGLSDDTSKAIKAARVLGLLRSRGFTNRLANMPKPVPIKDDDSGRYNVMILDGLLLNPATRFEGP
ncbi:hypothetical protein B0T26DRAFT_810854 [Lasiosphaeria miniovina]|uniref:Aminoglycoside phosphotransferase domain-containing protein n=1 Tax=Lasiosphaeria miniovina TaxID=1954250 RepID=A0AA40ATV8_9PEZI|nr:uncharacterized protein B0T26DRAFT_810854 [Lasiosphaeria miniovina]KAK0721883.1 hypothetical protein B0T26DRAFT_810854 [Lasiosphaeria miniovina]